MAQIEYGGIKVSGNKLLIIVPLLVTIASGFWGAFEVYKDYMDMKAKIQQYQAPDLDGINNKISINSVKINEALEHDQSILDFAKNEIDRMAITVDDLKFDVDELKKKNLGNLTKIDGVLDHSREIRNNLRKDIIRMESIIDKVEDDIDKVEIKTRSLIDTAEKNFEDRRETLLNQYVTNKDMLFKENMATKGLLEDKIIDLEKLMEKKIQRALDNPLTNRK
jgi:hypothetical protein